jgi:polyhydroxybutyrate depolymerase
MLHTSIPNKQIPMNKWTFFTLALGLCFTAFSCKKKEVECCDVVKYEIGKNRFTLDIDGNEREFYVHVPASYNGTSSFPVVFMLHGTSGDGEKFYNESGWRELGETENIITVFPSSGRYCIVDPVDGQKITTKWNTTPDAEWVFCAGEKPKDDIKFLKAILADLRDRFEVDNKRIYLVGFSNGGQMAAKCCVEMSDQFAAIVQSAGSFVLDTTYVPKRKLPITFQIGNMDWGPGNTGPVVPLSQLDTLLKLPVYKYNRIAQRHVTHFGLNPNFTVLGDTTTAAIAHYLSATGQTDNIFNFVLIEGFGHVYPNFAPTVNWNWMKQFTLP